MNLSIFLISILVIAFISLLELFRRQLGEQEKSDLTWAFRCMQVMLVGVIYLTYCVLKQ